MQIQMPSGLRPFVDPDNRTLRLNCSSQHAVCVVSCHLMGCMDTPINVAFLAVRLCLSEIGPVDGACVFVVGTADLARQMASTSDIRIASLVGHLLLGGAVRRRQAAGPSILVDGAAQHRDAAVFTG